MPLRTKLKVVLAFAFRLLLIPPSAARLPALHASIFAPHPANHVVRLQILSLLVCQVSVISATVPCAKPFFSVFASGIMGRPRTSLLLPLQQQYQQQRPRFSRQTSGRPPTTTTMTMMTTAPAHRTGRNDSIRKLNLRPQRGVSFASAEHVPVAPEQESAQQRPSLNLSRHSTTSIRYSMDFEVTFQDVGGLLNRPDHEAAAPGAEGSKGRGSSSAGFSWSSSWRSTGKSSLKSSAGSSQFSRATP